MGYSVSFNRYLYNKYYLKIKLAPGYLNFSGELIQSGFAAVKAALSLSLSSNQRSFCGCC